MVETKKSRKQEILDCALLCFNECGVEATTIDMIRERSGASVGSLYHHFGSKESIAVALYLATLEEFAAYQQSLLDQADTAQAGIRAIVHAYVDWVAANPDKAQYLLYSRSALAKGAAAQALQDGTKGHIPQALNWFKPYIDAGELKPLPRECYPSLIIGPAHEYARLWLSGRVKTNIKKHRTIFADAAWNCVKA